MYFSKRIGFMDVEEIEPAIDGWFARLKENASGTPRAKIISVSFISHISQVAAFIIYRARKKID